MPLTQASLEKLIEASPDIVVATDSNGNVAYYNDGAQENLGYSRGEIIGHPVKRLYPDLEEGRRVKAAMRDPEVFEKGRIESFPTRFVAKDGHEIPVAISGVILYGDDGSEQGTIGFAKDVRRYASATTSSRRAGRDRRRSGSHEINNPLSVITNELAARALPAARHIADERGVSGVEQRAPSCREARAGSRINRMIASNRLSARWPSRRSTPAPPTSTARA